MIQYGQTDCQPEDVRYNPDSLKKLDEHLSGLLEQETIQAGGYLMAKDGKIFAHRTMGCLRPEKESGPFMPDSLRPIASVTKIFTATAILQLIEQGKINLIQSVSSIIDEFDNNMYRDITIFQLLTHTSGIQGDPGSFFEPYESYFPYDQLTKENWIRLSLGGRLQYQPGTTWNYCSSGYAYLAEVITRVSGMDFDNYLEQNIFIPLSMNDTHCFVPPEKHDRYCIVSDWNKEKLTMTKESIVSASFLGRGGVISTLYDLWKFGQMMLNQGAFNNNRILSRKTVEAATKIQIDSYPSYNWSHDMFNHNSTVSYGLGWQINKHAFLSNGVYLHEGAEGEALIIDPNENFIYVAFYPDSEYHMESWHNTLPIAWAGLE